MDERMLKAMVAAGAIKKINIIASGARFHVEANTPNGAITAETHKGRQYCHKGQNQKPWVPASHVSPATSGAHLASSR